MDIYARTLVVFNLANPPRPIDDIIQGGVRYIQDRLPWLKSIILKIHHDPSPVNRNGQQLAGSSVDIKIREHEIWYALDLMLNQDASLYLDTRNLRDWAFRHLQGKSVLNTFAYTGSLGVAAMAGGASEVVHLDLNRDFLNLAKASYALNGFPIREKDFLVGDFFTKVNYLKRLGRSFDCIFLDPPFFSASSRNRIDLNTDSSRMINKVRPLVKDQGWLVAINNAIFVSGKEYLSALKTLCSDGYLKITDLIPVPEDISGYPETRLGTQVTDPGPFNHSTKIAVLEVRRKN